jgi:hypothetical protein
MVRRSTKLSMKPYVWFGRHRYDSHLAMELLCDLESFAGDEELVLRRFKRPGTKRYLFALEYFTIGSIGGECGSYRN